MDVTFLQSLDTAAAATATVSRHRFLPFPSSPNKPPLMASQLKGTADINAIEAPVTIKAYLL